MAWGGVVAGAALLIAPGSVQVNSDAGFVGVEVAHTFAQGGFMLMLVVGVYSLAVATALFSVATLRAEAVPRWFAIAGMVAAALLIGSYIWVPGYIFPIWVLASGVIGIRKRART